MCFSSQVNTATPSLANADSAAVVIVHCLLSTSTESRSSIGKLALTSPCTSNWSCLQLMRQGVVIITLRYATKSPPYRNRCRVSLRTFRTLPSTSTSNFFRETRVLTPRLGKVYASSGVEMVMVPVAIFMPS